MCSPHQLPEWMRDFFIFGPFGGNLNLLLDFPAVAAGVGMLLWKAQDAHVNVVVPTVDELMKQGDGKPWRAIECSNQLANLLVKALKSTGTTDAAEERNAEGN